MKLKFLLLIISVSITTTLFVLFGFRWFEQHRAWLSWKAEQNKIQKQSEVRRKFDNNVSRQIIDNLPDVESVKFLSDSKADIYINIPQNHSTKRLIVSDCRVDITPKNDIDISKTNETKVTISLDRSNCPDGWCMGMGVKIYTSHFLNNNEAKSIKSTNSNKYGDRSVYIDNENEFILESTSLDQPDDLCINGEEIQTDPRNAESSGEYFINGYTNLKLNLRDGKYCYQKFSGVTGFIINSCSEFKDPNKVIDN